ncbi:MAG: GntR family transcriptional regulator [Muribaculaceae bacterium]|nr:GntR family transcriptional regulator [Muribaculaceae bacterium]
MNFSNNKAIYLQIADSITDEILSGHLTPNNRIPSIRDLSAQFQVNVNTITRSLEYLQQHDVIYNQRGIGFFVSENAPESILEARRRNFLQAVLPEVCHQMHLLDIPVNEFINIYNNQRS